MSIKGLLIPIGGNEDKGIEDSELYSLDFITEGILSRVVKESGGIHSKIAVVTTASKIPLEVGANYTKAFKHLGCTDVHILDIRERKDSEKKSVLNIVSEANCVMFSGGDQSRIVDIIGESTMHGIIRQRYISEPIVIAGTSAGAMAMSDEMISGGSSSEALYKGSIDMREGMDLIEDLIIDSHFIKRGRFGRLAEAVARFPELIGVGLAEDTGIIIRNGKEFKVIGSGMVIIFDGSELTHNNVEILEEGTPMTMANLKVHVLANGDSFILSEKKVIPLPIEAEFE